jgi:hypothetical protein
MKIKQSVEVRVSTIVAVSNIFYRRGSRKIEIPRVLSIAGASESALFE